MVVLFIKELRYIEEYPDFTINPEKTMRLNFKFIFWEYFFESVIANSDSMTDYLL